MSQARYGKGLRAIVRALWSGVMDYLDAYEQIMSTIRRGLTRAWMEGLKDVGIRPEEMSQEEKAALQVQITTQLSYLDGFLTSIETHNKASGAKLGPHLNRAELWTQRYNETREKAKSAARGNPKLIWRYGDTLEHCGSCSKVAGRVYRKETWDRYGWIPQSKDLECGGWRCDCRREATEEPCTPGRPPAL